MTLVAAAIEDMRRSGKATALLDLCANNYRFTDDEREEIESIVRVTVVRQSSHTYARAIVRYRQMRKAKVPVLECKRVICLEFDIMPEHFDLYVRHQRDSLALSIANRLEAN